MHLLYIDPGSGSLLIQAVLGIALGVGVFFRTIRHKLRSLFGKDKIARDEEEDDSEDRDSPKPA